MKTHDRVRSSSQLKKSSSKSLDCSLDIKAEKKIRKENIENIEKSNIKKPNNKIKLNKKVVLDNLAEVSCEKFIKEKPVKNKNGHKEDYSQLSQQGSKYSNFYENEENFEKDYLKEKISKRTNRKGEKDDSIDKDNENNKSLKNNSKNISKDHNISSDRFNLNISSASRVKNNSNNLSFSKNEEKVKSNAIDEVKKKMSDLKQQFKNYINMLKVYK
jgi:hypothetical protein